LKRDYAEYQATYKIEGNVFTAGRKLTLLQDELPAVRASDYEAFHHAVNADLSQSLSIETASAGAAVPPADMKADDLVESGRAAMNSGNFPVAIALLKRATEIDPKSKTAWNNLGLAYLATRNDDDAIAAFKKQIELNPYDEFAYNNLGRAYWQGRRYDDAVTAFNKQLEINPLDKFAHGNLGAMYAEWHKYAEAAPELEKAASLTPDNPELQVSLGDAYLNLGQDNKALATFDRAVEISATPLVWNNIAYQLSLRKSHLDRAQQYAESAVSSTTAALRNYVSRSSDATGTCPWCLRWWRTGIRWAGFISAKATSTRPRNMWRRRGGWAGTARSETIWDRFTKSAATRFVRVRTYALGAQRAASRFPRRMGGSASLSGGDAKADAAMATSKAKTVAGDCAPSIWGKLPRKMAARSFSCCSAAGRYASAAVDGVKFIERRREAQALHRCAYAPPTTASRSRTTRL
jgi:tetratricopeptide (TPR) repeat protein